MPDRKTVVQVKFRLRQDVLRKLEREAQRNDRSVNDEIGRRLEQSFADRDVLSRLEDTLNARLEVLAGAEHVAQGNIAAEARRQGWRKVYTSIGPVWLEPGHNLPESGFIEIEIKSEDAA
jgi:hypothetical protein